jgi:hypothetical protein
MAYGDSPDPTHLGHCRKPAEPNGLFGPVFQPRRHVAFVLPVPLHKRASMVPLRLINLNHPWPECLEERESETSRSKSVFKVFITP